MTIGDTVLDLIGDLGKGVILDIYSNQNQPEGPTTMLVVKFDDEVVADRLPTEVQKSLDKHTECAMVGV